MRTALVIPAATTLVIPAATTPFKLPKPSGRPQAAVRSDAEGVGITDWTPRKLNVLPMPQPYRLRARFDTFAMRTGMRQSKDDLGQQLGLDSVRAV
jgi:hypothetical protein